MCYLYLVVCLVFILPTLCTLYGGGKELKFLLLRVCLMKIFLSFKMSKFKYFYLFILKHSS